MLCGCSGGGSGGVGEGASSSTNAPIGSGASDVPVNPTATDVEAAGKLSDVYVPVRPKVAAAGAVTGVIGPDSALTLDTATADGTTFHVEFPKGATVVPVTVTMSPLASLDGLPGYVAAAEFQPSGLSLVEPAVLTITGPQIGGGTRGFGYDESADGAAAVPQIVVPEDGPLRLVLGHFSGYGAVNETPTQWNISTITATEARDIIALEDFVIANTLHLLKSHDLSEAEANNTIAAALDAIADAGKRLGDAALVRAEAGQVDAATQVELQAAIMVILQAERAAQLTGNETDGSAVGRVGEIIKAYLTGVTKHCSDAHDLTVLTLLLGLSRQSALLGVEDDPAQDAAFDRCMSAEVHFTSTITLYLCCGTDNTVATGELRIQGTAAVNLFDQLPSVETPLEITSDLTVHFFECDMLMSLGDGTFSVQQARLLTTSPPKAAAVPGGPVPPLQISDASILLSLGDPTEVLSGCPNPGDPGDFVELFDHLHPGEAKGGGSYLFANGFEIPGAGSAVLARQTISREWVADSLGTTTYRSTTVIEVVHTPA